MEKKTLPYGMWPSPISATLLSQRLRIDDVQWDSDGRSLAWLEGRSERSVLVCAPAGEAQRDLTDEHNPHGGVGYGGGDFTLAQGLVFFAERDGRLYRRTLGQDRPRPITPAFGAAASPLLSPDGAWVLYVHTVDRQDCLAVVDANGQNWPVRLVSGADFYMQPAWRPDGRGLAWVEWDHPNMPWDGTRLKLGEWDAQRGQLSAVQTVAGGPDTPVFQPAFSPDGQWLSYVIQDGEWDALVIYNLQSGETRRLVSDASLLSPAWVQGLRVYGWSPSSQRLFYLHNNAGVDSLWQVDLDGSAPLRLDLGPYTSAYQIAVSPVEERLALIASAPSIPNRLITWQAGQMEVVRRTDGENLDPGDLPVVTPLSWSAADGAQVHGLYYAPANRQYQGSGLPPAILNIHGGPTGSVGVGYSAGTAFFTSRGYGVLEVNYRGSTRYGRSYMLALRQRWGDLDVVDAAGGAHALVERGLANPRQLIIRGGSAGGYTVLNALIRHPGLFKAGLCSFGVSNLFTLAMDTHKFEERYLDSMVGALPEASQRYHDWSPIFHVDQIQDALAVFQGADDKVVPPDQSEVIVNALKGRGLPHIYRLYPGEGHGFRRSETLLAHYRDVERFLQQHVLFSG